MNRQFRKTDRHCRGMSLVEPMVAIVIGLILIGGLIQVLVSNKQSFRLQDSMGVLQENGRFAAEALAHSIRMADHWGGIEAEDVTDNVGGSISGIGSCDQAWILDPEQGVFGYDGPSSGTSLPAGFPSGCIANYVPQSDILVVRYASPDNLVASGSLSSGFSANTVFVRSGVGKHAEIFLGSEGAPAGLPDEDGTYNFPYKIEVYYLRPCSIKPSNNCTDGIPTLVRLTLSSNTLVEEELFSDIEQLQFVYGSDSDGDGDVDRYDAAGAVPDWDDVVAVRYSFLARGDVREPVLSDAGPYDLLGHIYSIPDSDRHFHRKQFTRLAQIRNRIRR